ncbi:MAG: tRNA (guanosine(46)-N7)-methyltransferase TrmB [Cyanobacteria bacterium P01_G01_bin.54]
MARVRIRQHVNPLARQFQQPIALPDWTQVYARPQRPLHLDIGCARGRFTLAIAPVQPEWNFLGLEIREPLVREANALRDQAGLTNLHYLFCNVNLDLGRILRSLPPGGVQWVSIQFPDPWFKKRHSKRRVVQPALVQTLAEALPSGATVFLQSDVLDIATEMTTLFAAHPRFQKTHSAPWLAENPLPVPTEREIATQAKGEAVYRSRFLRRE